MRTAAEVVQDHRLALSEVLQALAADGIVSKADADKLVADRRLHRGDHHPLLVIADQKWRSVKPPQKLLSLEWLTEWLARQTGMEYFHIDPLKINFAAVTEVMSNHYAARFKVLPVEVNTREAVIATAEPYVKEWEKELKQMLRLEIRRVISTRTTSTSCTSSTGCGSTLSTSARATSTWSRAATWARCASASTACCTRCTRSRCR